MNRRLLTAGLSILFLGALTSRALAREIEDMRGRKVTVPDRIEKVFATSPPGTYLVYAIDPQLLVGLNFPLWDTEREYTVPRLQSLPVIGGTVGMGRTINQEILLKAKPDVIIAWDWNDTALNAEYEAIFRRMGIPWVYVKADSVWDWRAAVAFAGKLLGRETRGRQLRTLANEMHGHVKAALEALPKNKPAPTVYYAEGADGLSTEGRGSFHTELIEVVGARNVHEGREGKVVHGYGMEHVSLEQVMGYAPDVILVKEKAFWDTVFKDPRWKGLRAVREHRVFLIPHEPFNWFDRPPSFMRILGAEWLFSVLYPGKLEEKLGVDLKAETKAFYQAFLGVKIDDRQAAELLGP
jgi:iron complex transport system substrate-binding protein